MDPRVRRFRKQAREENRGRAGRSRRYSRDLRSLAVDYLRQQMKRGATRETVASELGISGWSLTRWTRRTDVDAESTLRAVEVIAEAGEGPKSVEVTLVTPDGYRIEGLKGLEIRSVLEALR